MEGAQVIQEDVVARLFEPDLITPEQYRDRVQMERTDQPEVRLMLAVMEGRGSDLPAVCGRAGSSQSPTLRRSRELDQLDRHELAVLVREHLRGTSFRAGNTA